MLFYGPYLIILSYGSTVFVYQYFSVNYEILSLFYFLDIASNFFIIFQTVSIKNAVEEED